MPLDPSTAIWTAKLTLYEKIAAAEQVIRVAQGLNFTIGGVGAEAAGVLNVLEDPFTAERKAFGGAKTSGPGVTSLGNVRLYNKDVKSDWLQAYAVDGRAIEFELVPAAGELNTDAEAAGHYAIESTIADQDAVTLALRDWRRGLVMPVQPVLYAGDNIDGEGLEGETDLQEKAKPLTIGSPFNVEPKPVNPDKLIYQACIGPLDPALYAIPVVRDSGVPLTSGATSWATVTNPFGGGDVVRDADFDGNGTGLAVGDGGKIARSTDHGATWASVTSPTGSQLNTVAWIPFLQLWILGGVSGGLWTSPTGTTGTFTSRTSTFTTSAVNDITCSDTKVLIVGDDGKAASSTNGTSYTSQTSTFVSAAHIYGAAWRLTSKGARFLIVGQFGQIATSPDAVTFTAQLAPGIASIGTNLNAAAGGRNVFVAGGGSGYVLYSDTGEAWTEIPNTAFTAASGAPIIRAIAVNPIDDRYVAVDASGTIGSSVNGGQSFTIHTTSGSASYYGVTFTGATWAATSSGGIIDRAATAETYASAADLEDDDLAPSPFTYKTYIGAEGAFIRLGSPPRRRVTCDIAQSVVGNELIATEDFTNAAWVKANVTVTANAAASPAGPTTADKLEATATAATANYQEMVATSEEIAFSVFIAKGSGATQANVYGIRNETTATPLLVVSVNLDTGVATYSVGTRGARVEVDDAPGWWHLTLTVTSGIAIGDAIRHYVAFAGGSHTAGHYSYAWGAQRNPRPFASKYSTSAIGPVSAAVAAWELLTGGDYLAGNDDYSVDDLGDLDEDNNAPLGDYIADGDRTTRAAALGRILTTVGAWMTPDGVGTLRFQRLEAPAENLVGSPDAVATAPWQNLGGTTTATNGVATYAGRLFGRINNANAGSWGQTVTLTRDGVYHLRRLMRWNGVAGTFAFGLFDATDVAERGYITGVIAADGTITVTATAGSVAIRPMGQGVYSIGIRAPNVVAAHTNRYYAAGTGTATSFLVSRFELWYGDADIVFDQSEMTTGRPMVEVQSTDENGGIPPTKTSIRYAQNFTPLAGAEIANDIDSATRARLGKQWLDVSTVEDAAIVAAHLLAKPRTPIETLFVNLADAEAEGVRLQALMRDYRRWHDIPMPLSTARYALPMGATADVHSDRYGMGAGTRVSVLGINPNIGDGIITYLAWGG